jgi:hypothetical protein
MPIVRCHSSSKPGIDHRAAALSFSFCSASVVSHAKLFPPLLGEGQGGVGLRAVVRVANPHLTSPYKGEEWIGIA